ncbi:MAG TPA: MFS transporter [Candidatus Dormibacteraeota bacterium]|nr:MFS transporter [Candidatus Dormibacteraeota bacterium]
MGRESEMEEGEMEGQVPATTVDRGRPAASTRYSLLVLIIAFAGVALAGFDSIARSVSLPLIVRDLHTSVTFGSAVFGVSFLVTAVADQVLGFLAERWGRKHAFLVALIATALTSGVTGFANGVVFYAIAGSLAGVCLSTNGIAPLLVGEETSPGLRGLYLGILLSAFTVGSLVISLVGAVVLPTGNWRLLFYLAFAPVILAAIAALVLREPPRAREARLVKLASDPGTVRVEHPIDIRRARRSEWAQIFAEDLRRQTIVLLVVGFLININQSLVVVLGVTYFNGYDRLPIGLASLTVSVSSLAGLAGTIGLGRLSDYLSPRNLVVALTVVASLVIMTFAVRMQAAPIFALVAVLGLCASGSLAIWNRYVVESYPTRARGTGLMLVSGVFFLNGTFAPPLFGALIDRDLYPAAALIAGGIGIIGALILLGGRAIPPRRELEEIAI